MRKTTERDIAAISEAVTETALAKAEELGVGADAVIGAINLSLVAANTSAILSNTFGDKVIGVVEELKERALRSVLDEAEELLRGTGTRVKEEE